MGIFFDKLMEDYWEYSMIYYWKINGIFNDILLEYYWNIHGDIL